MEERVALESDRKCLSRSEIQSSFLEYRGYKVIYRRYASLFFIVGTKPDLGQKENNENELGMLEFIHCLVETMDRWAGSICELDIMYQASPNARRQEMFICLLACLLVCLFAGLGCPVSNAVF